MPSFIRHIAFGGLKPAVSPKLLSGANSQVAHNVTLGDGRLCPLKGPVLAHPGPAGSVWTAPSYDDHGAPELVVFPDPEVYLPALYTHCSPGLNHTGVFRKGQPPMRRDNFGVLSPLVPTAPTTPLAATDVTPPSVTPPDNLIGPDARAYTYTWVYAHNVESRPAPPVAVMDTFDGAHWQLTLPPPPPGVLGVRIYRMTYGADSISTPMDQRQMTSYHLVEEIDPSITVWTDTLRQSEMEMGELLTADQCDPPDMEQVFAIENGMLVGWDGNKVFFSEHGEPWNWPAKYRFEVEDRIIGIAVTGNSVFIGTNGRPYRFDVGQADGEDAHTPIRVFPYREFAPIQSRYQISSFPWGAVLACDYSLVQMTESSLMPLIRHLVTDEQWRDKWRPGHLSYRDGRLYAAGAKGGLAWMLDLQHDGHVRADTLVTIDLNATRLHYGIDGELYFIEGGQVYRWGGGPPLAYHWKSPAYRMRGRTKFAAAKVEGDFTNGPSTISIIGDGNVVDTHIATGYETWRLPQSVRYVTWELDVSGVACIDEIHVAQSKYELIQVARETPQL